MFLKAGERGGNPGLVASRLSSTRLQAWQNRGEHFIYVRKLILSSRGIRGLSPIIS